MTAKGLAVSSIFLLALAPAVVVNTPAGSPQFTEVHFTLGQAFMGPVGTSTAFTRMTMTNRDLQPCGAQVLLSRGSATAPPVAINGELAQDNGVEVTIPRGGVQVLDFTATILVQGVIAVAVQPPCSADSLSVTGTYFVTTESGLLEEAFTIPAHSASDWLAQDRCVAISYNYDPLAVNGIRSNLGVVTSSVLPGVEAPLETMLTAMLFDAGGQAIGDPLNFEIDGIHSPFFPLDQFPGLEAQFVVIIFCLSTSETQRAFQLDLTAIGVQGAFVDFQFEAAIFADGFESGDTSAWSN